MSSHGDLIQDAWPPPPPLLAEGNSGTQRCHSRWKLASGAHVPESLALGSYQGKDSDQTEKAHGQTHLPRDGGWGQKERDGVTPSSTSPGLPLLRNFKK